MNLGLFRKTLKLPTIWYIRTFHEAAWVDHRQQTSTNRAACNIPTCSLLIHCLPRLTFHNVRRSNSIIPTDLIAALFEEYEYQFQAIPIRNSMEISQYESLLSARLNVSLFIRGLPLMWQLKEAILTQSNLFQEIACQR